MALFILQPGIQPLGQFDFDDTDLPNILGGEIGTWAEASRTLTSAEKAAQDVLDGYVADQIDQGTPDSSRPELCLADATTETYKFFPLLDDGKAFYGTLFGSTVGGTVGLTFSSTNLGPHTAIGSGKVTAWDKPGLYAVSLTAVYSGTSPNEQLEAGGDTPLPGELLYRYASTGEIGRPSTSGDKIAQFVEMSGNDSLVTTSAKMVGATEAFDRIKIYYLGAVYMA